VQRYEFFLFAKMFLENYSENDRFWLFCRQQKVILFSFLNQ